MATLSASVAQVARPQSSLAEVARPQAGGFSREYDFGQFILTFSGIQLEDFDGNDLETFST
jgi:hypothetical protein